MGKPALYPNHLNIQVSVGIKSDLGKALIANKSLLNQSFGHFTGAYSHRCYFLKGTAIVAK
ncbi:hypothetical protein AMS58_01420 [Pseudoalteromonas porphyrae]|uniref:Uncharacterized protein n=1 Tax=Pseudoalteromonas porphyrae TaxID=187330 RepID=A0A0N0LYJ1_9GAMM|nr:hypothetical protein ADS77_14175 [Pseudoalteromonas porphyrae]KPH96250.1 hypothetical protein AMS58_01420 [Pseudoalteromonas porphyrae]